MLRASLCVLAASLVLPLAGCSSTTAARSGSSPGAVDGSVSPTPDASTIVGDSSAPSSTSSTPDDGGDAGPDLDMEAGDFTCILAWTKVGDYRITNMLGDLTGALAVANAPDGGVYPVGTVIQLIPNEAMVKRHTGFNASADDWEFFNLTTSATGTVINQRGGSSVTNFTGSSCESCHGQAAPQWDLVCGTTHGCTPLPISESTIQSIQNGDPRCVDGG